MIGTTMLAIALGTAAGAAWLFGLALRSEHLLVLRGAGREVRLFERRPDGRYAHVHAADVPRSLWRFARGMPLLSPVVAATRRTRRPVAR